MWIFVCACTCWCDHYCLLDHWFLHGCEVRGLFISATLRAIPAGVLLLVGWSMLGRFGQTKWESHEVMGCNTVTVPIPQRNSTQCCKYQNFKDQLVPKGNDCYNENTDKKKKIVIALWLLSVPRHSFCRLLEGRH